MRTVIHFSVVAALLSAITQPIPATAADFRSADEFILKSDETIDDDLYICGRTIKIEGTIDGDLIAWGQEITINGTVKGSLIAAGQTVVLNGQAYNARLGGQVIKLGPNAKLEGDLLAGGLSLECAKDSSVGGDVLFGGYQALLAGQIGDEVRGNMANCRLEGSVGGDVRIHIGGDKDAPPVSSFGPPPPVPMPNVPGGLTVADTASVEGDLTYEAKREASIDPKAAVKGEVKFTQPMLVEKDGQRKKAAPKTVFSTALVRLRHLLSVGLVGLLALVLFPRLSTSWADTIRNRPVASFLSGLIGLAAFIAFLIIAALLIAIAAVLLGVARFTELLPVFLVSGLVGYTAVIVGFWIITAFLAEALLGLALGRAALRDETLVTRIAALLLGIVVFSLVLSIPWLGGIVGFFVFFLGLGSICLWLVGQTPTLQSFGPPPATKPMPATVL